ncbi:MAG: RnfABCDGE type electron transport complex subunit B [Firmicutes bacterium]|nr:RnfABCDGE type electron transport complex subunit B [Bacillota bacterium]
MEILYAIATLGGVGILLGILLGAAAHFFALETDPRVEAVRNALPGANCGACAYAGCNKYAEAIVEGRAPVNACTPGGSASAEAIAAIMGQDVSAVEEVVAAVFCRGDNVRASEKFLYDGISDCAYAQQYHGGFKTCPYGCLGLGNCVRVCPFDAIAMGPDGLPQVDEELCTGCGLCRDACPRGIIRLVPKGNQGHLVWCSSQERGKTVTRACEVGCTGCRACVRACPQEAISMEGNLAVIDLAKCDDCGLCMEKCRFGSILPRSKAGVDNAAAPKAASA